MAAESDVFTTAGTTLEVTATSPATYDLAGFEALNDWVGVGEIVDFGEFGREYNLVTHNPIGDRRTIKRKGSYNDGSVPLVMARVPGTDAGQDLLRTARDDDSSYYFKVTYQDGGVMYYSAQVMSYTSNLGSVDNIVQASCNLEIDNDIIEKDAA